MYDVLAFGRMMMDERRINAYLDALRKVITPDSLVLELGTGTGIVAFAAHQAGARRVVALEPLDAIEIAVKIAADNNVTGVEFLQMTSEALNLDEPADILISDMRGKLPILRRHIPSIIDVRKRLLKPNATLIAKRDRVFACPIQDINSFDERVGLWALNPLGMDMSAAAELTANGWYDWFPKDSSLLAEPGIVTSIDWATVTSPNVDQTLDFVVSMGGVCHGFGLWFETDVDDDITISTAPDQAKMAYGRAYFPVDAPIEVDIGTRLTVRFIARLIHDAYVWRWIVSRDGEKLCDLTTLGSFALSPTTLHRLDLDAPTKLNAEGKLYQIALEGFEENRSLEAIGERLLAASPTRFLTVEDGVSFAGALALAFGD